MRAGFSRLDKAGGAAGEQTEKNADLELEQEVAAIAKQYTAAKGEETRQKTETAEVSGEAKSTEKKTTVPKEVPQKPKAEETAGKKMGEKRNTFFSGDRFGQKNPTIRMLSMDAMSKASRWKSSRSPARSAA